VSGRPQLRGLVQLWMTDNLDQLGRATVSYQVDVILRLGDLFDCVSSRSLRSSRPTSNRPTMTIFATGVPREGHDQLRGNPGTPISLRGWTGPHGSARTRRTSPLTTPSSISPSGGPGSGPADGGGSRRGDRWSRLQACEFPRPPPAIRPAIARG
jgi:hypothetical protein